MMDLDEFHYHLFARFKSSHRKPEMGGDDNDFVRSGRQEARPV